ncbi:MAG TPA: helix-turn-helix domain-containing protein [Solirubrobacteraceae bacterium]|nr:helix-turn-helix domain-containing protein [Solirubrobacteraceae bacterium]
MNKSATQRPPRRADAERNRDQILAVARAAFADPDAEISMAEIARRAGVGMATLYRNFPGRRELLEALYADEVAAICEAAERLTDATPGAALRTWLSQAFAFFAAKRPLAAELLKDSEGDDSLFSDSRSRVIAAGKPLLAAAQEAHQARGDLAIEQILEMIAAIAHIQRDPSYLEPILQTTLDGLRPTE